MKKKINHWLHVLASAGVYAALLVAWQRFSIDGARLVLLSGMWILIACSLCIAIAGPGDVKPIASRIAYLFSGLVLGAVAVAVTWCGYPVTGSLFLVAVCFSRAIARSALKAKAGV
ncbi:hypothetical protein E2P84_03825 [Burkholderia cepacia]|uniref:hypothetical protein n=1 Tax=Burkholderia TaxID=32008 RepID=UPI000E652C33|nr:MULTISPECIES: hypothetical protein [Burkholderia]MCR5893463.1 hypothetical protein [Burkholderia sp. HAN2018]TES82282.1 hypothetical protein E2P84_03825 [Burkholderia cepacia]